jgi:hypothetical protein
MDFINQHISFIIAGGILLTIFILAGWVIKRRFIDKSMFGTGAQFFGRQIYNDFQNADRKAAIEHVIYIEEDDREEAFGGEDIDPDENNSG